MSIKFIFNRSNFCTKNVNYLFIISEKIIEKLFVSHMDQTNLLS
jgi:hypothetical protein